MPIHPTAVVDPKAQIDPTADVGPYAIIGPDVRVGPRTRVMAHVNLTDHTTLGADNQIHPGAVIGFPPQHLAYKGAPCHTVIGDRNIIREYASINGSYVEGHKTIIGNDNYLMIQSHVGHDAILGSNIVLCNGSLVSGHVEIEDRVFISGLVAIHQFVRIGTFAMCTGITRVNRDVPPYMMVYGDSEIIGLNLAGLRRAGFGPAARNEIKLAYRILYECRRSLPAAIALLKGEPRGPEVQHLIEFLEKTKRGICGGLRSRTAAAPSAEVG